MTGTSTMTTNADGSTSQTTYNADGTTTTTLVWNANPCGSNA